MKIAVIGLGIIGGSFCKAIKKHTDHYVIGVNRTRATAEQALRDGAIDGIGSAETLGEADLIILCMYPQACVDYVRENGKYIRKGAIVTDKEKNGYEVSEAELYEGASFIITPCGADDESVRTLAKLAIEIGFGTVKMSDPEEHDRMIAFTSQLPHVLACAYVLSPSCPNHNGFSAGSYRDVSRVANINSKLWSELFLENREPLMEELAELYRNLSALYGAIRDEDRERLAALLEKGHSVKQALGE